ncbi:hypothetical protein CEXT_498961 [Caerostris extrusa]|uniref:Ycf15 n=1 Tax=Caerostris extrusa TaxID=172846 RepID=A0AAV4XZQ2_CAEEX|nr:hypothetical protein CEXT_498961 [Caerostris extrusa]
MGNFHKFNEGHPNNPFFFTPHSRIRRRKKKRGILEEALFTRGCPPNKYPPLYSSEEKGILPRKQWAHLYSSGIPSSLACIPPRFHLLLFNISKIARVPDN